MEDVVNALAVTHRRKWCCKPPWRNGAANPSQPWEAFPDCHWTWLFGSGVGRQAGHKRPRASLTCWWDRQDLEWMAWAQPRPGMDWACVRLDCQPLLLPGPSPPGCLWQDRQVTELSVTQALGHCFHLLTCRWALCNTTKPLPWHLDLILQLEPKAGQRGAWGRWGKEIEVGNGVPAVKWVWDFLRGSGWSQTRHEAQPYGRLQQNDNTDMSWSNCQCNGHRPLSMSKRLGDQLLTLTVYMVNFRFLTSKSYFLVLWLVNNCASHTPLVY